MSRKDVFSGLQPPADPASDPASPLRNRARPILGSPDLISDTSRSPVGAISQSLSELSERNRRAEEIERRLAEGQAVVSLETADIDASFVPDRMPETDEDHARLVHSMREHGQQVPILVRPHPVDAGRYQVAFGHRRLRAAAALDRKVLTVVRDLSDEQLVIAQGQENNERQDLSYIEKVRFAERLQARFSRDVIMAAMSIYKGDLSNMLSVAARIPADVIDAIGPAPGIGRRSWMEMADLLAKGDFVERAREFLATPEAREALSADRFKVMLAAMRPPETQSRADVWTDEDGTRLARVTQDAARVEIIIDRKHAPDFAAFVLERLPALLEDYRSKGRQ